MKKRILVGCIAIAALAGVWLGQSLAQVAMFGGPTSIYGTVNGNSIALSSATVTVRPIYLTISGGTNAATVFVGNVLLSTSTNFTTNTITLGSITNAVGTNTWSTNISAFAGSAPLYICLQGSTGTNAENATAQYGP